MVFGEFERVVVALLIEIIDVLVERRFEAYP